jgi:putative ABC transport system permease protein
VKFILKMAWRDSRASRRRLLLCALSVAFGIAALVALGSFCAGLGRAVRTEAKGLLGADLVVATRAPMPADLRSHLYTLGIERSTDQTFSSMMAFPTAGGALRLVQVHAIEGGFPFYGKLVADPGEAAGRLRGGGNVAIVEEALLNQFDAKVGDKVRLGRSLFTVVGALKTLPGETFGASLFAPRALIPRGALAATGLTGLGSLARQSVALRLAPGTSAEGIAEGLWARFPNDHLSIATAEGREKDLGRALTHIYAFLSLVGFIAVLLGAIGLASALHVYVRQKIPSVAVLRCLGAGAGRCFGVYLVQGLVIGVFGALCGAVGGVALQFALLAGLGRLLPYRVSFFVAWPEVARGMASGLVLCALFTLWSLLSVRRVPPLAALRAAEAERPDRTADPWRTAVGALIAAGVVGLAIGQTHSIRLGLGFAAMLGLGFGALAGVAQAVAWAARRVSLRRFPYPFRQGVANLHRPNNLTVLLLLSLGLATFLSMTVYLARSTLLAEISQAGLAGRTNLMFFDVQPDEIGPLARLLAAKGAPVQRQVPVVTMKIARLAGRAVQKVVDDRSARIPSWTLQREYRSTFRDSLVSDERLVAGEFTGRVDGVRDSGPIPISMEEGLFRDMRLRLGDEIVWDVQGVPLRTAVTSVRAVEWRRLEPNFFVVFPVGVLEEAPATYLAAVRAEGPGQSARLQRAMAAAFPGVSAIDLSSIMNTLDEIFSRIAVAIEAMALFTAATGLAVLASAVLAGRRQRRREAALLRTLGATGRQLARIELAENAVLGALGGAVGCVLAVVANALLAHFLFKVPAEAPPLALAGAVAVVTGATLATGWLAGRGATRHPPLEALRADG